MVIDGIVAWAAWPAVALLVVLLALRRRVGIWRTLGALSLATYGLWIVSAAFFPISVGEHGWPSSVAVNRVPLRELVQSFGYLSRGQIIRQHGGNFLLLVPFTLLGPLLWSRLRSWKRALAIGVGASATIELLQLALSALGAGHRSTDIDDVIVNTAGAMCGYALFVAGRWIWRARHGSPSPEPIDDQPRGRHPDQHVR